MKKLILLLFVLVNVACIDKIYAQTLPVTITVTWDPAPATDNVTSYDVKLDNGTVIPVVATGTLAAQLTVTAYGHHVASVVAKNVSLACDDPTQCNSINIQSSAPATAGFTVNPAPGPIKINKVTKP